MLDIPSSILDNHTANASTISALESLPLEIAVSIFELLPLQARINVALCSKQLAAIAASPILTFDVSNLSDAQSDILMDEDTTAFLNFENRRFKNGRPRRKLLTKGQEKLVWVGVRLWVEFYDKGGNRAESFAADENAEAEDDEDDYEHDGWDMESDW